MYGIDPMGLWDTAKNPKIYKPQMLHGTRNVYEHLHLAKSHGKWRTWALLE